MSPLKFQPKAAAVGICLAVAELAAALVIPAAFSAERATLTDSSSSQSEGPKYIASTESNRFHLPTCELVKKIDPENKVPFNYLEDVEKAGYTPCPVCDPKREQAREPLTLQGPRPPGPSRQYKGPGGTPKMPIRREKSKTPPVEKVPPKSE